MNNFAKLAATAVFFTLFLADVANAEVQIEIDCFSPRLGATARIGGWGFTKSHIDHDGGTIPVGEAIAARLSKELKPNIIRIPLLMSVYDDAADNGEMDEFRLKKLIEAANEVEQWGAGYIMTVGNAPGVMKQYNSEAAYVDGVKNRLRADRENDFVRYIVGVLESLVADGCPLPIALGIEAAPTMNVQGVGIFFAEEQWSRLVTKLKRALGEGGLGQVQIIGPLARQGSTAAGYLSSLRGRGISLDGIAMQTAEGWTKDLANSERVWLVLEPDTRAESDSELVWNAVRQMDNSLAIGGEVFWLWHLGYSPKPGPQGLMSGDGEVGPLYCILKELWSSIEPGSTYIRPHLGGGNDAVRNMQCVVFKNEQRYVMIVINRGREPVVATVPHMSNASVVQIRLSRPVNPESSRASKAVNIPPLSGVLVVFIKD